jgi:hypothetical protein
MRDYQVYYDIENYVRKEVHNKFHQQGYIEAFDFFYIIIWKANRAKSRIAKRLFKRCNDLDSICKEITQRVNKATSSKERLRIFIEDYEFRFPTASAILSILYPDKFSVYDVRVCGILKNFKELANITNFEKLWKGYEKYLSAVKEYNPSKKNYTEADQNLWGKSSYDELKNDIDTNFFRLLNKQ